MLEGDPPLGWEDEGIPPEDPGEPELPLGGELGTGMLLGLGWVTVSGRHPAINTAPSRTATARC